jgi:hypothetical protein
LKRLVIDIKDGYAAIAAGGEFEKQFFKIEFEEADFIGESGETRSLSSLGLFEIGEDEAKSLYEAADETVLVLPMRFSMVKPVSLEKAAVESMGDEILRWEAKQQLPDELGEFVTGFYKLRDSFDNKSYKYLFYASSKDFVDVLSKFVSSDPSKMPVVQSEAFGLYTAINLASDNQGLGAAISLEHDGAAVVVVHDGDFITGKFIYGDSPALGEEIMYYVVANMPEDTHPHVLICGDLSHVDCLGSLSWATRLYPPESMGLTPEKAANEPGIYIVAAGLNQADD